MATLSSVEQLAGRRVPGDVHPRGLLVHDGRAQPGQPVDHPVDGGLVARHQRGRQDDGVAGGRCVTWWWSPRAIRPSADSGSPCDPVEISTTCSGGIAAASSSDDHQPGRRRAAGRGRGRRPCCAPSSGRRTRPCGRACAAQSSTCWMRCTWLAKQETISRCGRPREDVVQHRADAALGGDEAGHLGVGRVRQQQVDAGSAPSRAKPPRSVSRPSSGSWSILKSPVCTSGAGRGVHGDRERVGDRVVDRRRTRSRTARPRGRRPPRPRPAYGSIRCSRSLASTSARVNREPTSGMSPRMPQQVRHGADVVLVPVGEDDGLDVVEPVLDHPEVGQDQVDAGLLGLGEQHAAVDDQQPAVELEDGHVAADLAQAAERHDPQAALGQRRRRPSARGAAG